MSFLGRNVSYDLTKARLDITPLGKKIKSLGKRNCWSCYIITNKGDYSSATNKVAQLPYITYTNKTHSKGTVQMKLCTQSEVRAVKTGTGRADKLERRC